MTIREGYIQMMCFEDLAQQGQRIAGNTDKAHLAFELKLLKGGNSLVNDLILVPKFDVM